jgi:hypothetical protein
MTLAFEILLRVTLFVVVTGIIAFIVMTIRGQRFRAIYFVIWIIASAILIGITYWSWHAFH